MAGQVRGTVACFSYLAAAELWQVGRFPLANGGTEVRSIEHSIAADGPMAAAVLTGLDVPTVLLANDVGDDAPGNRVSARLQRYGVPPPARTTGLPTPQIVVVADEQPTRTWFPYLPGVADALAALDLTPLVNSAYAYIDCYQLIEPPAVRAIQAARAADVPVLINLGGSPLSPAVVTAVHGYPHLSVQTNVDDADHANASDVAASILTATDAAWAIVTAGAHGAVALSRTEHLHVPAFHAMIRHTHCAGAAFSGGLLYGLLHARPMSESLVCACASGTLRCEREHCEPMPTLPELQAFISSRPRTLTDRCAS
jgi:sugar/nucleoside kinase (ribokinase family)